MLGLGTSDVMHWVSCQKHTLLSITYAYMYGEQVFPHALRKESLVCPHECDMNACVCGRECCQY